MLVRRRAEQLLRPRTYTELATNGAWWVRRRRPAPTAASWVPDAVAVREAVLRWPRVYENPTFRGRWPDALRANLARLVRVTEVDVPQPHPGVIRFEFLRAGRVHDIVLDYYDYTHVNAEALSECSLYFKMQHRPEGYGSGKVVPGGYFHESSRLWAGTLPHARGLRDGRQFRYDAYGRFSLLFAREMRTRAVHALEHQQRLHFGGGLRTVPFGEFMREVARSKVCVDLPGNGPLCVRLCNYFGIGACVVAAPHAAVLHVPLVEDEHLVYCSEDLSDLVDVCAHYVERPAERDAMCLRAREYYDRYLTFPQLARYYLATIVERVA